jgi:hypothetical protein
VIVYVVAHHDTVTGPTAPTPAPAPAPDGTPAPGPGVDVEPSEVEESPAAPDPDGAAEGDVADPDEVVESPPGPDADTDASAGPDTSDVCTALDGVPPPMFAKPLREVTFADATAPTPGGFSTIPAATVIGGGFLPGPVARRAALHATIRPIIHPGQAPPEARYTPSRKLAEFLRCRDLTCRFPGCTTPATTCDLDHTIPWPCGPTAASNLKCLCRKHHLLKTFWGGDGGWRDRQEPDGTVVWTAPDGQTYTTTPAADCCFRRCANPPHPSSRPGHRRPTRPD